MIELTGQIKIKKLSGKLANGAGALQQKIVNPTTDTQSVKADPGYYGLSVVKILPVLLQEKTVEVSGEDQTYKADAGYHGLSAVTVIGITDAEGVYF